MVDFVHLPGIFQATPGERADMDYTLALVMALLQLSVCMAAPVTRDLVNIERMKTTVTWMAQQLVVRMDRTFPVTRHLFHELHLSLIGYWHLAH